MKHTLRSHGKDRTALKKTPNNNNKFKSATEWRSCWSQQFFPCTLAPGQGNCHSHASRRLIYPPSLALFVPQHGSRRTALQYFHLRWQMGPADGAMSQDSSAVLFRRAWPREQQRQLGLNGSWATGAPHVPYSCSSGKKRKAEGSQACCDQDTSPPGLARSSETTTLRSRSHLQPHLCTRLPHPASSSHDTSLNQPFGRQLCKTALRKTAPVRSPPGQAGLALHRDHQSSLTLRKDTDIAHTNCSRLPQMQLPRKTGGFLCTTSISLHS